MLLTVESSLQTVLMSLKGHSSFDYNAVIKHYDRKCFRGANVFVSAYIVQSVTEES